MLGGFPAAVMHLQFDPIVTGPVIAEYQPFYRGGLGVAAAGAVCALVLSAYANRRLLRTGDLIWLLVAFAMLLRMGRFAPLFAVGAAPVFAVSLPWLSERLLSRRALCAIVAVVLGTGTWRVGTSLPGPERKLDEWINRHGPDTPGYPTDAAAYVEAKIPPKLGRIINEYTWGGYIEWRLGNKFQALLDGRTNLYTKDFWKATYLGSEVDRLRFFANVRADAAILPVERSAFHETLAALGWSTVYRDDRAEVLVPPQIPIVKTEKNDWHGLATLFFDE
jgi:hypothetical protein